MDKIGCVMGRFQVFHNDHLKYLLEAKKRCEFLYIGITSPDQSLLVQEESDVKRSRASSNPLTYYERMHIINNVMKENYVTDCEFSIVPFPIENPELINSYIPKSVICFLTIYDKWGETKKKRLISLSLKTEVLWDDKPKNLVATDIRNMIINGEKWEDYVPPACYKYMRENGIDERIKMNSKIIAGGDKNE